MSKEDLMDSMLRRIRYRLDDLDEKTQEFEDEYILEHIENNLDVYNWEIDELDRRQTQLVMIEAMIDIVMALKVWSDGESYSYKNDAIQITRGLMSKHFQDTINLLKEERNVIIGMDGGFA